MGITPQDLKKIMNAREPAPDRGGFVASHTFGGGKSHPMPTDHTSRQFQACFNGRCPL